VQVYQQTSRSAFGNHGFVEALPASPTTFTSKWAQGSADAVKLHMWVFEEAIQRGVEDLLVMSGDHLYRMDYRFLLRAHRQVCEVFLVVLQRG
jgi:glucose-1-phosphate adenylyltransferase